MGFIQYQESKQSTPVGPSQAETTSAQHMGEYQRALLTLTPRLVITPTIVAANILVFVAMVAAGAHIVTPSPQIVEQWGANYGPNTMNGQWWRLMTCMFLHFGILHLGFNMWILWEVGRLVERLVGNVGFLLLYFVSGIAGSITSLAWNPVVVSAGASGAVFGVVGALLGYVALRRDTIPPSIRKQLRRGMATFLIYNVLFGISLPGIDMACHLGGLGAGFLCGLILSQPLSDKMIRTRRIRNASIVVIGAIALPLAAMALPAAPRDIQSELRQFGEIESSALQAHNELTRKAASGVISHLEFANTLEIKVLPPWMEVRVRIEELIGLPYADRPKLTKLLEYVQCRERSWRLHVEGLREQNRRTIAQANKTWREAEEMGKQLRGNP